MQTIQITEFAVEEAATINRLYEEIQAHAKKAVGESRLARDKALELGDRLNKIKTTLAHGQFLLWIKQHCQFNRDWASKLMRLANVSHGIHLSDEMSLRAAMVALGIIPDQPHAEGRALGGSPDPYAPVNVFNRYLSALPSPEKELWRTDPAERAAMRQQYLPLRSWLDELFGDTPTV